jgi:DNA-binding transcriptional LysR family regulator
MARTQKSVTLDAVRAVTIDRLEAFRLVIEQGGYAAAAPGNPVRQSLLNRQVHALAKSLGANLTRIERGRVLPTAEGARLLVVVNDLFEGLARVAEPTEDAPVEVSLAGGDSALQWLVVPALPALLEAHPRVRLSLAASADAASDVQQGRVHLGIARNERVSDTLRGVTLGRVPYGAFIPRGLDPQGGPLAERLARVPLARVTSDSRVWDALFEGRTPRVALSCETFPQAARAVATGRYAAILPLMARSGLDAEVVAVPSSHEPRLGLVARSKTLDASPALRAFYDALASALQQAVRGLSSSTPRPRR